MRSVTYYKDIERKNPFTIEYDENAPCIICGEPVISASMGGTVICPACDCGRCRYCQTRIDMIPKEEIKKHMICHKNNTPKIVKDINNAHKKFNERFDKLKAAVK